MLKFHVKHLFLAGLLGLVILPATAQKMYRCPSAGGGTTFSDTPCANSAGGEISVKPARGAAPAQAKPDPQTRGAMNQRNAEYNALLTPECRRAREAFLAKTQQKGGMDELMKEGNPISKAWEACEFEAKNATEKLHAKDRERLEAEDKQKRAADVAKLRQTDCDTKRKTIAVRKSQEASMSDPERAVLRAAEVELSYTCR